MEDKIRKALERPIYPYIYGLSFIIYKSAQYFRSFELFIAFGYFIIYCAITYILSFIIRKSYINNVGLILVMLWASLLHFVNFAQKAGFQDPDIPAFFFIFFYLFVLALLPVADMLAFLIPLKYNTLRNKLANTFLLISCFVFIAGGIFRNAALKIDRHIRPIPYLEKSDSQKKKDIVWILMDEYGSSISLKNQFNFNNPLDSSLRKNGFTILDSTRSRFTNTLFSLQSIFNIDDSIAPVNFFEGADLLKQGSLVPVLESVGYKFSNLNFFTINSHKPVDNRSGYPEIYPEQLFSGTLFHVLNNRYKYSVMKCDDYNRKVIEMLGDTLSAGSMPKFIWAHISIPHAPYCRDRKGKLLTDNGYGKNDLSFIKKSYLEYLEYGNMVLLKLLKDHPELLEKIVIISGDHGPRFSFLENKDYQSWPFVAINIPGKYDTAALKRLRYISELPGFLLHWLGE